MNSQDIRLQALKLLVQLEAQSKAVVTVNSLIENAASLATFIQTGKSATVIADADGRPDDARAARLRSFNDEH